MTRAVKLPSAQTVARIRAIADRRLSAQEFDAYVNAPYAPGEREDRVALIGWYKRRYKTAGARLCHARVAYARWVRSVPSG